MGEPLGAASLELLGSSLPILVLPSPSLSSGMPSHYSAIGPSITRSIFNQNKVYSIPNPSSPEHPSTPFMDSEWGCNGRVSGTPLPSQHLVLWLRDGIEIYPKNKSTSKLKRTGPVDMEHNTVVCGRRRVCVLWINTNGHDGWLVCLVLQETDFHFSSPRVMSNRS